MNVSGSTKHDIEKLETFLIGSQWCNYLVVRLTTKSGVTGLGEATLQYLSAPVEQIVRLLFKRFIYDSDPFSIERAVYVINRDEYTKGGPALNSAIAGLEMALWDICGKITEQPVYNLLGGALRKRLPAYANGWFNVMDPVADFAATAKETVDKGYVGLKFDPFWGYGREPDETVLEKAITQVAQVREAIGPSKRLMIDTHGRFSVGTASVVAKALAEHGVYWMEEPVDPENYDALARVQKPDGLRIATGERCYSRYQAMALIERGKPDVLQPDPVQIGGILESKKFAILADSYYTQVSFHNPFGPVAAAAALQVSATAPNVAMLESFCEFGDPWRADLVKNCPMPVAGEFIIPDAPGLGGIELVEDVVREHPYNEDAYSRLWGEDDVQ